MKASRYLITTVIISLAGMLYAENKPAPRDKDKNEKEKTESLEDEKKRLEAVPLASNTTLKVQKETRWEDSLLDNHVVISNTSLVDVSNERESLAGLTRK